MGSDKMSGSIFEPGRETLRILEAVAEKERTFREVDFTLF